MLRAGDRLGADIVIALRRIGEGEAFADEEAAEIDALGIETDGPDRVRRRDAARDTGIGRKSRRQGAMSLVDAGQGGGARGVGLATSIHC